MSVLITGLLGTAVRAAAPSPVVVLTLKGMINPVTADYISRGIREAEDRDASACVIELDTPGGLDTSMRDIVQDIVSSRVPVVVYVSPSGARAASAGTFITLSAHVAAMAPDTAIGAASPVSLSSQGVQNVPSTEEEKTLNDAAAYIRSLATAHGRNADWAESAVREAVSATEKEALDLNVVDVIATDLPSLLQQIDGRQVTLLSGAKVTLNTASATIQYVNMTWIENFLLAISDPNIAYVLLSLAGVGLWVEISNPGLIFPGVFGGISFIFALFSLGNLPVNLAGILLMLLAFIFFIVEAFTHSHGFLTAGGIISLVIGGLILFKGGPLYRVSPWLIALVAIFFATLLTLIVTRVVKVHRLQPVTGSEGLIGARATVRITLNPEGTVFTRGELWTAVSEEGRIEPGETVVIKRVENLKLFVGRE
jgi:membrane-bound serine protease (ClpP class)